jgi:hypothetical protein
MGEPFEFLPSPLWQTAMGSALAFIFGVVAFVLAALLGRGLHGRR